MRYPYWSLYCSRGHRFTPENTTWKQQGRGRKALYRQCKICRLAKETRWRVANIERYRIYHREWTRRYRANLYLYHAIKDNGREVLEAVYD